METLEIVIGLIFIFLLLSLLATTVQEIVATLFSMRGRVLLKALMQLLEIEEKAEALAARNTGKKHTRQKIKESKVYQKYRSSWLGQQKLPSYLSAEQAIAVINDILRDEEHEEVPVASGNERQSFSILPQERSAEATTRAMLPTTISHLQQSDLKKHLTVLYNSNSGMSFQRAGTGERSTVTDYVENLEAEVEKAKAAFNKQYEEIMDRASGWYKRNVQLSLMIIGLIIGVAFDADTFKIYSNLTKYPDDRQKLLELADAFVDNNQYDKYYTAPDTSATVAEAAPAPNDTTGLARALELRGIADSLLLNQLQNVPSPLGLGWEKPIREQYQAAEKKFLFIISKLGGWLVTALAISLGAPFWFDMLQKVIQIRSAGTRPNDKKPKPNTA